MNRVNKEYKIGGKFRKIGFVNQRRNEYRAILRIDPAYRDNENQRDNESHETRNLDPAYHENINQEYIAPRRTRRSNVTSGISSLHTSQRTH